MEVWKEVKGYPNYKISSYGRIKSLDYRHTKKEKILKPRINPHGYFYINLYNKGVVKTKTNHQLVAIAFLNHTPCGHKLVINHINFDKTDNRVENLEIVTQRENINKKHIKSSSQYVGVNWVKEKKKWMARIKINGKLKYLGYFENEIEASKYYQNAIISIKNNLEIIKYKKILSTKL